MSVASSQPSDPNSSGPSVAGVRRQADRFADLGHRVPRYSSGLLATLVQDSGDFMRAQLRSDLTKRTEYLDHALGKEFLLVIAPDLGLATEIPVMLPIIEEELVESADVARSWMAAIGFARPLDVGNHVQHLFRDYLGLIGHANDVANRLRHPLLAVH